MADLAKIFTGMPQGPEKIDENFGLINQALTTVGDNHKFEIQYYPLVTENGWTTNTQHAFMKAENDQLVILVASFEIYKPKGIDFQSYMEVGIDPIVHSLYNGGIATAHEWASGAMTNALFLDGKIQVETLTGSIFSNVFTKDSEARLRVDQSFIWAK